MSLATSLERAIAERDGNNLISMHDHFAYNVEQIFHDNESAILAALKFTEAVEWHQLSVYQTPEGEWIASTTRPDATNKWRKAATPAAAVASLVSELEKK